MSAPASGFAEFFSAIHQPPAMQKYRPFPWQEQLAEVVISGGSWPDLIDVPTGLGKTATLDIAVYAMAAAAERGDFRVPRRVFFVVDRRLVVDEAYNHAVDLCAALADPEALPVVRDVARRLASLCGDEVGDSKPIDVTRMRGGTTWESSWVDRPDRPTIVIGTVDQVGSRLFFRGYGTTDYRKPMDAALVGTDSLILVDEAHLAQSMLASVDTAFASEPHNLPVKRAKIVRLTATPGEAADSPLDFDIAAHLKDEVATRRLKADKNLHLAIADPKKIPAALSDLAVELLAKRPGAKAMIVCNTVDVARRTHEDVISASRKAGLSMATGPDGAVAPELAIGRARSVDRDERVNELLQRFGAKASRVGGGANDILVATQTVEVGANLDVDILITESAPLSALVQRLGRLNRFGQSCTTPAVAVVVHDGHAENPVYGVPRQSTWDFLQQQVGGVRDLAEPEPDTWPSIPAGPLALRELLASAPTDAVTLPPDPPLLLRPTLRSWARTSPRPDNDTPVGPYLHGLDSDTAGVTLLWRDDLFDGGENHALARLAALPFIAAEGIEVPYRAALAWLTDAATIQVADIDANEPSFDVTATSGEKGPVMVHRGDRWARAGVRQIRPGDVVAVPAAYGGLDEFGWNPAIADPVVDVRDIVTASWRRPTLRLDERTPARILRDPSAAVGKEILEAIGELRKAYSPTDDADPGPAAGENARRAVVDLLSRALRDDRITPRYRELVERLTEGGSRVRMVAETKQLILRADAEHADPGRAGDQRGDEAGDDGDLDSSVSTTLVKLADHHAAVGARARAIANAMGIDPELSELVVFAAEHHDLGKLDVRFQAQLLDGNVFMAKLRDEPLAKSGIDPYSQQARDAYNRSGLPQGFRHETWSAYLAAQAFPDEGRPAWHRDLVAHLVATHHGRGRPLAPPVVDENPQELTFPHTHGVAKTATTSDASVDWASPSRFERLNDRFGMWGLALLETIVRSADQTCSKDGS